MNLRFQLNQESFEFQSKFHALEISLITYNIHKAVGNDQSYRLDRIIDICRDVNADVLALQEVPYSNPRSDYEDIARIIGAELGMEYVLGLNVMRKLRGAYGNATFSRFPIKNHDNLNITWSIKKPRGCLNAVLELPNGSGPLAIMNFHLGLAGIERIRQFKMILASAFAREQRESPLVLLGDTNDIYNRLTRLVREAGLHDTFAFSESVNTYPAYAPILRLDKVFCNERLKVRSHRVIRNRKSRIASDHLPVHVRFELVQA